MPSRKKNRSKHPVMSTPSAVMKSTKMAAGSDMQQDIGQEFANREQPTMTDVPHKRAKPKRKSKKHKQDSEANRLNIADVSDELVGPSPDSTQAVQCDMGKQQSVAPSASKSKKKRTYTRKKSTISIQSGVALQDSNIEPPLPMPADEDVVSTIATPQHTAPTSTKSAKVKKSKRSRARERKKSLSSEFDEAELDGLYLEDFRAAPATNDELKDSFEDFAEQNLEFPQIFGHLLQSIFRPNERQPPPPPNLHFEYTEFVDVLEKRIRKEFQTLRLQKFGYFCLELALEPVFDSKVVMREDGISEPKFYKINSWWAWPHVLPFRLVVKGLNRFVEVRINCGWQRMSVFLDIFLPSPESSVLLKEGYDDMFKYWEAIRTKKKQGFRFMDLPLELRRMVYRNALFYDGHLNLPYHTSTAPADPTKKWLLLRNDRYNTALLTACDQIRDEAIQEFYAAVNLRFFSAGSLNDFRSKQISDITKITLSMDTEDHAALIAGLKQGEEKFSEDPCFAKLRVLTVVIHRPAVRARIDDHGVVIQSQASALEEAKVAREAVVADYHELLAPLKRCQLRVE